MMTNTKLTGFIFPDGESTLRNFLRPFRGVHKKFLEGYVTICEFAINIKSVTFEFISKLVQRTYS